MNEKNKIPEKINVEMSPKLAFGVVVDKEKTDSGIYIPETAHASNPSPIVRILAVGEDFKVAEEGDKVYVNTSYLTFAELDNVKGVVLYQDSIIAKVK